MTRPNKTISLKARAVNFLSRREHSRLELQRKLARYTDDDDEISSVLDELQSGNWQSDSRYAHAYANRNSVKHGLVRIINDLRMQGIDESCLDEIRANLANTEFQRAIAVWEKKFDQTPANAKEYAKQYRFMLSRGFSNDCIRKILANDDSFD